MREAESLGDTAEREMAGRLTSIVEQLEYLKSAQAFMLSDQLIKRGSSNFRFDRAIEQVEHIIRGLK